MQTKEQTSSPSWSQTRRVVVGIAAAVTFIALFYAEEDLRGRIAWSSFQREAAAKGIELNPHALEPAPVPDDDNFAMTPLLAPLYDYTSEPSGHGQSIWRDQAGHDRATKFSDDFSASLSASENHPGNPEAPMTDLGSLARALQKKSKSPSVIDTRTAAAEEIIRDLQQYDPMMDELRTASLRPASRFNVHYDDANPSGILLPHLSVIKRAGVLLFYRASAELALGRKDAALEDVKLMLYLANSIRTEPFLISQLVSFAVLNLAQQDIWEGLANHAWSDAQLLDLQSRLEKLDIMGRSLNGMRWELAVHSTRLFDFIRQDPRTFFIDEASMGKGAVWVARLTPSGWSYFEQVNYARIYSRDILDLFDPKIGHINPSAIDASAKRTEALMHLSPVTAVLLHRSIVSLLIPNLSKYCQKAAFCATMMDETAIVCALERYRLAHSQYPESLAVLAPQFMAEIPHDIITGEPLKYHTTSDGQFILYSVGWNEKDDDGKIVLNNSGRGRDMNQGDWAWQPFPQN